MSRSRRRPGGRRSVRLVPLLAAVALVVGAGAACTGGGLPRDKSGGAPSVLVLRMAVTPSGLDEVPAIAYFVRRVLEVSDGRVRIDLVAHWGDFGADSEVGVVRAVGARTVDLGWVGSRVFGVLGDHAFDALSAPMLIDSYPLENAVVAGALPSRMLRSLDGLGVVGLAVAADGLRQPFSAHGALTAPESWSGVTFGTYRSTTQEAAVRALGATPVLATGPFRLQALQAGAITGFELDLAREVRLGLEIEAPYVVRNVTLWPQLDVLVASPDRLSSLPRRDRGWIARAAADAVARSEAVDAPNAAQVAEACARGVRFVTATPAELAALRAALAPVYAELRHDPATAGYLDDLARLKATLPPPPPAALRAPCAGATPG